MKNPLLHFTNSIVLLVVVGITPGAVATENPQQYCEIIIEGISLEKVEADDGDRKQFNSNNHWPDDKKPDDYQKVIRRSHAKNWIHIKGEEGKDYHRYKLYKDTVDTMVEAVVVFHNLGYISRPFKEDIKDIVNLSRYKELDKKLKEGKWFVRTDLTSLKYVQSDSQKKRKQKVYSSVHDLFLSMPTAPLGHNPIYTLADDKDEANSIHLYLFPWVDIDPDKEFRVFVHNNRVTAISQQALYRKNDLLLNLDETERQQQIHHWCRQIVEFIHKTVSPAVEETSYVTDLAILGEAGNEQVYFIEQNPFGSQYTSGSGLFHWQGNENILYGHDENLVTFRYVE